MSTFFCPGRTELGGSHTDHQFGRIMAAAIDMGITADADPNNDNVMRVFSSGFEPIEIPLDCLWPNDNELGTSAAMVRGIAATLQAEGIVLHGFDAHIISDMKADHGFAMGAAFTVLIGYIIQTYSDSPALSREALARAAQKADARWTGRSAVLSDYLAPALGGGLFYDFAEDKLTQFDCPFHAMNMALCLTDTGGFTPAAGKARLQIVADMNTVAASFGAKNLSEVRRTDFEAAWPDHSTEPIWRRARYYFDELPRVIQMADALGLQDGQRYIQLMNASGRQCEQDLCNITAAGCSENLADGLALSAKMLDGIGGWRVHGPGFGGGIQALMPIESFPAYQQAMDERFGAGACQRVRIFTDGVRML